MSRNFDVLRRAERERQHRFETEVPLLPELRESNPVYEPLLGGEIVEGGGVQPPLGRSAREQIASLVKGLFLLPTSTTRAVAVAATEPNTDVAAITMGAAECLSNLTSSRVCIVDANFDNPQLHTYFGLGSTPGLSDVMNGQAAIRNVLLRVAQNLWVVPAGTAAGLDEQHSIDTLTEIMVALRRESDYLLLQSPSLSDTNSAIVLAKLTDGLVVVLEANRTRRDFVQTLKAKLDAANVWVLGAVFNNRTYPIPRSIYSRL